MDYTSKAHMASANLYYHPNTSIKFSLGANISKSEAQFNPIQMPTVGQDVLDAIEAGYYDYSMINNYSDLSYTFVNFKFGTEYKLSQSLAFTVDVDYYDLTDKQGYVYGDETGSFYIIRTGLRLGNFGF
ncbi:hypothetical protein B1H10_04170 [candidate division KSB1 bacterium 4484_188]|nr:MAG: hypothetical protein B1H10_04170 [candidate division KSB1 bacterium 4484_188]